MPILLLQILMNVLSIMEGVPITVTTQMVVTNVHVMLGIFCNLTTLTVLDVSALAFQN